MNGTVAYVKEYFDTSKEIIGERIKLSLWEESIKDVEELFEIAKVKSIGDMAGWKPHSDIEESLKVIKEIFKPNIIYKITLIDENKVIGSIGFEEDMKRKDVLSLELGYFIDERYQNKGYCTEAGRLLIEIGFYEWMLDIIAIQTNIKNEASKRVIEKLGFLKEGIIRKKDKDYKGVYRDVIIYSLESNRKKK